MAVSAASDVDHHQPPSSVSSSSSSLPSVGSVSSSNGVVGGGGSGGLFTFRFEQSENGSFLVSVFQENRGRSVHQQDDVGALYYVVAVILIYGCSILMMIASYIRKNKVDRRLNRYLKEMANVRKRERRMTLMTTTAAAAAAKAKRPTTTTGERSSEEAGGGEGGGGGGEASVMKDAASRSQSPSPSFNMTPSGRESPSMLQTGSNSPTADMGAQHQAPPGACSHSPFLGVDRLGGWPSGLQPSSNHSHVLHHHQRPSSPVLIVCDHSDYDSDSEPNNSDRSDDHPTVRHPVRTGRKSVQLCVPIELATAGQDTAASAVPSGGQTRQPPPPRRTDCSSRGSSAAQVYGARQQDSVNSSDCRSDDEVSQKPGWNSGPQVVSNV